MNMHIPEVLTPPYMYHSCSTQKVLWEGNFTPENIKIMVVAMLENTEISRMVRSTPPWTSLQTKISLEKTKVTSS